MASALEGLDAGVLVMSGDDRGCIVKSSSPSEPRWPVFLARGGCLRHILAELDS
jgi:hypothetical protein